MSKVPIVLKKTVERAIVLGGCRYVVHCQTHRLSTQTFLKTDDMGSVVDGVITVTNVEAESIKLTNFPSWEDTIGIVSIMRPFIQCNDPLSIMSECKGAKPILKKCIEFPEEYGLSPQFGFHGRQARSYFEEWLKKPTIDQHDDRLAEIGRYSARMKLDNDLSSRFAVWELLAYGEYSHLSQSEHVESLGQNVDYFRSVFHECICQMSAMIGRIGEVCQAELSGDWSGV